MRLLMWILTIAFALSALTLWVEGHFLGALDLGRGLAFLALLSCPFFWARPDGLVPDALAVGGKRRLMLGLALVLATPLLLPWQLWL